MVYANIHNILTSNTFRLEIKKKYIKDCAYFQLVLYNIREKQVYHMKRA